MGKQTNVYHFGPTSGSYVIHTGWPKGENSQSTGTLLPAKESGEENVDVEKKVEEFTAADSKLMEESLTAVLDIFKDEAIEE